MTPLSLSLSLSGAVTTLFVLQTYEYRSRCLSRATLLSNNCSEEHIYENQPQLELLLQNPLKDYETRDEQAVQVQPQRVFLKLVKGLCVCVYICNLISPSPNYSPYSPYSPYMFEHVLAQSEREQESVSSAACTLFFVFLLYFFGTVLELCHRFVCSADLSHFI